jgi:hypothetical protein
MLRLHVSFAYVRICALHSLTLTLTHTHTLSLSLFYVTCSVWAVQDLAAELYDSYYVNFCSPVPGALLSRLAAASVQANAVMRVAKVAPMPQCVCACVCMHARAPRRPLGKHTAILSSPLSARRILTNSSLSLYARLSIHLSSVLVSLFLSLPLCVTMWVDRSMTST